MQQPNCKGINCREGTLYADVVGVLPVDWLLVALLGGPSRISVPLLTCISLLRLLQLVAPSVPLYSPGTAVLLFKGVYLDDWDVVRWSS
jgi:hypothetical protein